MTPADFTVARSLADRLIATCEAAPFPDELEALTIEQCRALDSIAFECVRCNQWYDARVRQEIRDEWVCAECARETTS